MSRRMLRTVAASHFSRALGLVNEGMGRLFKHKESVAICLQMCWVLIDRQDPRARECTGFDCSQCKLASTGGAGFKRLDESQ
jgi:hypothetical protein